MNRGRLGVLRLDEPEARTQPSADWRGRAACRLMPADMFFPVGTSGMAMDEVVAAKGVCRGCEVTGCCLEFALETRQEFGIWGGTDEEERREMLRRAKAARLTR